MAQLAQLSDDELQNISDSFARNGQAGVEAYLNEQKLLVPGTKEALDGTSEAVDEALSGTEQAAGEAGSGTAAHAYSESLKEAISSCPQEVRDYIAELEESLKSAEDAAAAAGDETGSNYSDKFEGGDRLLPSRSAGLHREPRSAAFPRFSSKREISGAKQALPMGKTPRVPWRNQGGAVAGSADFLRASAQSSVRPSDARCARRGKPCRVLVLRGHRRQRSPPSSAARCRFPRGRKRACRRRKGQLLRRECGESIRRGSAVCIHPTPTPTPWRAPSRAHAGNGR